MEARNVPANIPPAEAEVKVTHADPLTDSTLVSLDSGSLRVEINNIWNKEGNFSNSKKNNNNKKLILTGQSVHAVVLWDEDLLF